MVEKADFLLSSEFTGANDHLLMARFRAFYYETHLHDSYTLGLVRKGRAFYETAGQRFVAKPGDVFLFHPFEVHEGGNRNDEIEYDALYPSAGLINFATKNRREKTHCAVLGSSHIRASRFTEALFKAVDAFLESKTSAESYAPVEQALQDLFAQDQGARMESISFDHHRAVHEACLLMQSKTFVRGDIGTLHERVGLSRFHFIRVFRKATNLTPTDYYLNLRLANARNLIRQGYALADAALLAEFSDQAHMTRAFRARYGFSPGKMKQALKQLVQ